MHRNWHGCGSCYRESVQPLGICLQMTITRRPTCLLERHSTCTRRRGGALVPLCSLAHVGLGRFLLCIMLLVLTAMPGAFCLYATENMICRFSEAALQWHAHLIRSIFDCVRLFSFVWQQSLPQYEPSAVCWPISCRSSEHVVEQRQNRG